MPIRKAIRLCGSPEVVSQAQSLRSASHTAAGCRADYISTKFPPASSGAERLGLLAVRPLQSPGSPSIKLPLSGHLLATSPSVCGKVGEKRPYYHVRASSDVSCAANVWSSKQRDPFVDNMGVKIVVSLESPFTIHNIPYGVISTEDNGKPRCATAIGDYAIDLAVYSQRGRLSSLSLEPPARTIFSQVRLARPAICPGPLATETSQP